MTELHNPYIYVVATFTCLVNTDPYLSDVVGIIHVSNNLIFLVCSQN